MDVCVVDVNVCFVDNVDDVVDVDVNVGLVEVDWMVGEVFVDIVVGFEVDEWVGSDVFGVTGWDVDVGSEGEEIEAGWAEGTRLEELGGVM